ncbi:hypothetical protein ACOME3_007639 [Neoechinorhynchus agilis]
MLNSSHLVIVGYWDMSARIFEINRNNPHLAKVELSKVLYAHMDHVTFVKALKDRYFITGSVDGVVCIWMWREHGYKMVSRDQSIEYTPKTMIRCLAPKTSAVCALELSLSAIYVAYIQDSFIYQCSCRGSFIRKIKVTDDQSRWGEPLIGV